MRSTIGLTILAVVACATSPARALPPTVGINPGYDRRLQESRREVPPAVALPTPLSPRRPGRRQRRP